MAHYRTGKRPARAGAMRLKFRDYLDPGILPHCPDQFGHENLIAPNGWGVYGNDTAGNCFWAGTAHQFLIWNKAAGRDVQFSAETAIADYSAATGYRPGSPKTDQGTDMVEGARWIQNHGVTDTKDNKHRIAAFLEINPKDLEGLAVSAWLFGCTGLGIEFPDVAMKQFEAGKPWTVVAGTPRPTDGHFIPIVGRRHQLECVTWGRLQPMSDLFVRTYADEAVVMLTEEMLDGSSKTPEGFDFDALKRDLLALRDRKLAA